MSSSVNVDLNFSMRRLKKISESCGSKNAEGEEAPVDTSNMSEFEKGQYHMAMRMKKIRDNIEKLDDFEKKSGVSATSKAEVSNDIRKDIAQLKRDALEVKKAAQAEGKRSEYEALIAHKAKTEQLFQSRFVQQDPSVTNLLGSSAPWAKAEEMGTEMRPMMSVRDDEEFQLFFTSVKQADKKMDEALDRIGHGVTRLRDNALQIKSELTVQEALLRETEHKVDKLNDELYNLNAKLKKTLDSVEKDSMCLYLICSIILLAMVGFVLYATGLLG